MISSILFEEIQGGTKTRTRQFFTVLTVIFIVCILVNLLKQKGRINDLTIAFLLSAAVFLFLRILFGIRLVTQVRTDGIYVRYLPFQPPFAKYLWQNIEEAYMRDYQALPEYGGWGMRWGPSGRAFTALGGHVGLQLVLRNGNKVLIGTHQPEKLMEAIRQFKA